MTTTTKPTVRQGKLAIDEAFSRYMDGQHIDPLALDVIGYAVANELQLRDYLLAYYMETGDLNTAVGFVNHLIEQGIHEHNRNAFYTILSALHFTNSDRDLATLALDEALKLDSNYALAKLLARVYGAGWSPVSFKAMAQELHPKVLAEIETIADRVIEIK